MNEIVNADFQSEMVRLLIFRSIIVFIVWIFFANTIRLTLKQIKKENQAILPNQAWFLLIPYFNIFWNFEVVKRLSYSFNNEFYDRKIAVEENPTFSVGMIYAWSFLIYIFPYTPAFITVIAFLISLVYLIIYWIKINQYKDLIIEHKKWEENNNIKPQ